MEAEERLLQEVVDECLNKHDVLITRARRLRGQEAFEPEPSLKVCVSGAMSRKEVERCAKAVREVLVKVCGSESSRLASDLVPDAHHSLARAGHKLLSRAMRRKGLELISPERR